MLCRTSYDQVWWTPHFPTTFQHPSRPDILVQLFNISPFQIGGILNNLCAVDRCRVERVFPGRFTLQTLTWLSSVCDTFSITYDDMNAMAGSLSCVTGPQMVAAVRLLLPTAGIYMRDVTVNYGLYGTDVASAAAISRAVRRFCPNMVRIHVQNASQHCRRRRRRPAGDEMWEHSSPADDELERMVGPMAALLESFVYCDVNHDGINHDDQIITMVGDRCKSLESLSINRSCVRGDCLEYMVRLVYLKVHTCMFMPPGVHEPLRPFRVEQLKSWCHYAWISHLDIRQDTFTFADVKTMLRMPRLRFLDVHVDDGNADTINGVLRTLLRSNKIRHLSMAGNPMNPYELEDATVWTFVQSEGLQRIHLMDCCGGPQIRSAFRLLRQKNPRFRYRLN